MKSVIHFKRVWSRLPFQRQRMHTLVRSLSLRFLASLQNCDCNLTWHVLKSYHGCQYAYGISDWMWVGLSWLMQITVFVCHSGTKLHTVNSMHECKYSTDSVDQISWRLSDIMKWLNSKCLYWLITMKPNIMNTSILLPKT